MVASSISSTQRILVTGGAGFIGSHTVNFLLEQGKEVIVLDNLSSGKKENLPIHANLEFVEGDILEFSLLADLTASVDAVLHLAALASVPLSIEQPIYSFQVNVQGFLHVLEAIRRAARNIRLVYASSAAVYGDTSALPCRDDEQLPGEILSPYALHKMINEQYAALYAKRHGLTSLGLRYFNVYGPKQDPKSPYSGVITYFIDAYHRDQEFTVFGDGLQSRDFIYVSDVVRANYLALQSEAAGQLNIATGNPQTLLDLIACLESVGKKPVRKQFGPARCGDIRASYAATALAQICLHFSSSISLAEGIKQMMTVK